MMKKLIYAKLAMMLMLLAGVFTLAACGEGEDEVEEQRSIVGTWECQEISGNTSLDGGMSGLLKLVKEGNQMKVYLNGKPLPLSDLVDYDENTLMPLPQLEFKADNRYTTYIYSKDSWILNGGGEYKHNGKTLSTKEDGDEEWVDATIKAFTANALEIESKFGDAELGIFFAGKITMKFKRVK